MADIDWDEVKKFERHLDKSPEAEIRFNATIKRAMNVPTTPEEDRLLAEWVKDRGW